MKKNNQNSQLQTRGREAPFYYANWSFIDLQRLSLPSKINPIQLINTNSNQRYLQLKNQTKKDRVKYLSNGHLGGVYCTLWRLRGAYL